MVDITSNVGGIIQGAIQGNNPDAGFPLNTMCQILTGVNYSSPYEAIAHYVHTQQGDQCLDVDSIGDALVQGATRSWTWQTCIEFGFFQTDVASKIFGGIIGLQYYYEICQEAFSKSPRNSRKTMYWPDTQLTNYLYGGLNQGQSSWIIFSNGYQDPWGSNLGINKDLSSTITATVSTSAHCAAYHKPNRNDPPNLISSRKDIKKFVKEALKDRNY